MIIDTHNHAYWLSRDADWLVAEMDSLGIDVCWLLTWYHTPEEDNPVYHRGTNPLHARPDGTHGAMPLSDVIAARDRHPTRFVASYCPPPAHPSAPQLFEAAYRIHGVRVCGEWSYRMPLDDPRAINLFRKAGELKCPVVLHMDVPCLPDGQGGQRYQKYWIAGTVLNLERALQACPETIFIGHCPGFWREISGDADTSPETRPSAPITPGGRLHALFDTYPNLWADLSAGSGYNAMNRDPEHARTFIEKHQDRLLFGRDQYGDDMMRLLAALTLDETVERKLYAENALRLVPLDGRKFGR